MKEQCFHLFLMYTWQAPQPQNQTKQLTKKKYLKYYILFFLQLYINNNNIIYTNWIYNVKTRVTTKEILKVHSYIWNIMQSSVESDPEEKDSLLGALWRQTTGTVGGRMQNTRLTISVPAMMIDAVLGMEPHQKR